MGSVPASCGFVFASSGYMEQAEDFLEIIRLEARIPILTGCTGSGLIGGSSELEFKEGFSLLALSLPDVDVKLEELPDDAEEAKPLLHGKSGAILLANPFTVDSEAWLDDWNA